MIYDPDSEETTEFIECTTCHGSGGFDASTDCEIYDDWHDCVECNGQGVIEI